MTAAAILLAAALFVGRGPRVARQRAGAQPPRRRIRREKPLTADPFAAASALDLFSVCLCAGMTVPAAAAATAPFASASLAALLRRAADLVALGADPETAWQAGPGDADEVCVALARLARRSASSGSALARGAADLAEEVRQRVTQRATAAAERAGVLIAGPLGLCFLPAFVCLGVVPVVAGLAGEILGTGLL
jgi:pilus assembly protein TadC